MRIPLPTQNPDGSYSFVAVMAIDGDGANGQSSPPVYAPKGWGETLDYLANAGGPGNWYGIVTSDGSESGNPLVQVAGDPAPGAYISATSYEHDGYKRSDPNRYVDAAAVPYIVIPSHWRHDAQGIVLGCRATVEDIHTGQAVEAAVLDFGPRGKCGEASIACADQFGVSSSPKNGGTEDKRFRYTFWPGVAADGYELKPM